MEIALYIMNAILGVPEIDTVSMQKCRHFKNFVHFELCDVSIFQLKLFLYFPKRSANSHISVLNSIFSDLEEAGDCSVLVFDCFGLSLRLLRLFPAATSSAELSSMVLNGELHWLKSESRP